jgi:hypothetical protein
MLLFAATPSGEDPLGGMCCVIFPALAFIFIVFQVYRLRRTFLIHCSICGQPFSRGHVDERPRNCPVCKAKVQIETLSEEQRDAFRRTASSGENTTIQKEAEQQLGVTPRIVRRSGDGFQQ